jgi:ParB-like chromosome segregation protein Spo0J
MTKSMTVPLDELEHDPIAIDGHEHRLTQLDDLLASLPHKGQLQSLRVRPFAGKPPKKGNAPKWWVSAGNRRLATLRKLRDTKGAVEGVTVTGEFPVHVILGDEDDAGAYESSRSENLMRLPETPVEEFRAFAKMAKTTPAKEIASRFGVTVKRVEQRLKLAALHPDVLAALEAGKITFEAAQAFTIESDPAKQAAYLKRSQSWQLAPHSIKAGLTEKLVRGNSELAKLIGKKAYVAAGGKILGDAFDGKSPSYWISSQIITKLVDAHWAEQKAAWTEEGWLFAETAESFGKNDAGYGWVAHRLQRLKPAPVSVSDEAAADIKILEARVAEITAAHPSLDEDFDWGTWEAEHGDEQPKIPGEIEEEFNAARNRIDVITETAGHAFTAEQKAASGVVFWSDGSQQVLFGVVRPGDKVSKLLTGEAPPAKPAADLQAPGAPVSLDLSQRMTVALQAKVRLNPELALRILVASLRAQTLSRYDRETPVKIMASYVEANPNDFGGVPMGATLLAVADKSVDDLLVDLADLVAHNLSVKDGVAGAGNGKQALISLVDPRVPFDPDAYFAGITKPLIQLAWRDMTSPLAGQGNLADGKKGEMATKAANQARATGWLPPQLRTPSYVGPEFATTKVAPASEQQQAAE